MKKLLTITICMFFVYQASSQCLMGDCDNGYGIYKYKGEIYRSGYW